MPLSSWLFIRNSESIWVERPYGSTLIVAGPGSHREQRDFIDEKALDAFQVALAERLAGGGWFLWAYDRDRRTGGWPTNIGQARPRIDVAVLVASGETRIDYLSRSEEIAMSEEIGPDSCLPCCLSNC
jgi:hypothetical protein